MINRLKRAAAVLLRGRPLAHEPIRLTEEASAPVRVSLETAQGSRPVDEAHVPISLRPLLLGVWGPLEEDVDPRPSLLFEDRASGRLMGRLRLEAQGTVQVGEGELRLYAVRGTEIRCTSFPVLQLHYLLAWRHASLVEREGRGFAMTAPDLRALAVYYMHPRPVYLVCIEREGRRNVFPMDLVGPLPSGHFSMALRLTNPSVAVMKAERRLTVSSVEAEHKGTILSLASHHGVAEVDWETLPFAAAISPHLRLPYPDLAFRVKELEIEETHDLGSHCLFLTRPVAETELGEPRPPLAYQSGLYSAWQRRVGRGPEPA